MEEQSVQMLLLLLVLLAVFINVLLKYKTKNEILSRLESEMIFYLKEAKSKGLIDEKLVAYAAGKIYETVPPYIKKNISQKMLERYIYNLYVKIDNLK